VCQAVLALMSDPAADSPLNCDAGARTGAPAGARAAAGGVSARGPRSAGGWRGNGSRRSLSGPVEASLRWVAGSGLGSPSALHADRPPLACLPALPAPPAGNLLRNGDQRGFNSLAKMYTIEHAMGGEQGGGSGGGGLR
jgi:hypothetical protein